MAQVTTIGLDLAKSVFQVHGAAAARELVALGHDVRLMPAQHVKPYVKRGKNDAVDFCNGWEAGARAASSWSLELTSASRLATSARSAAACVAAAPASTPRLQCCLPESPARIICLNDDRTT